MRRRSSAHAAARPQSGARHAGHIDDFNQPRRPAGDALAMNQHLVSLAHHRTLGACCVVAHVPAGVGRGQSVLADVDLEAQAVVRIELSSRHPLCSHEKQVCVLHGVGLRPLGERARRCRQVETQLQRPLGVARDNFALWQIDRGRTRWRRTRLRLARGRQSNWRVTASGTCNGSEVATAGNAQNDGKRHLPPRHTSER